MDFLCRFGYDRGVQVGVTPEETAVLIRWRKRSDNHALVRMKAEAILYASEGVSTSIIAKMVERAERTVQEWPADWQATRMCPVLTGHAGNQDAAEPARAQKEELKAILARPPSPAGVRAGFWDVPAIREVVKILFDARYQADSSYQLLLRLCGPNLEPPGPVRRAPRRESHHPTHGLGDDPGQGHVGPGPEGPHRKTEARPEHEAWTRRMQPPKEGSAPSRPWTGRRRPSSSPAPSPRPAKKSNCTRSRGTGTPGRRSSRWTCSNAKPAPARSRSSWTTPDSTTPRCWPASTGPAGCWSASPRSSCRRTCPTTNPAGHVRNAARNDTATIQHETPEETLGASASYITDRTVDHDFEHLPAPRNQKRFCFMTAIGTISTDAAKNINTYRTPRRGVGDREALDGLDPADFQVGDKSAYAGDEAAARTFADPRIGNYENGYTRFDMHPDFKNEFAQYKSPYTEGGPSSVQYAIPAGKIDRFNELTINREWVSYDKISGS